MTVVLTLPNQYGYVLLCATLMAFQIIMIGFIIPGKARAKVFTQQFMKTNFGSQHQRATNKEITKGGYPDMGSGFYAKSLSYQNWYLFNNAQRAHYNFLEWITSCLVFLLISGLYFPIPASLISVGVMLGRLLYACGYNSYGPNGRLLGVSINFFSVFAQMVLAFISAAYFAMGKPFVEQIVTKH